MLGPLSQTFASDIAGGRNVSVVYSPEIDTPSTSFIRKDYAPLPLADLTRAVLAAADTIVFDVDLAKLAVVSSLKDLIGGLRRPPTTLFAVDRGAARHFQTTQAYALGARAVIERPLSSVAIREALSALDIDPSPPAIRSTKGAAAASIAAAHRLIGASFAALSTGSPIELDQAMTASHELFSGIGQAGLERWLDTVRAHHAGTFQHCLLVTGAVVAYASHTALPEPTQTTLTIGALLHDVGKATIPNAILDKPGALTSAEFALVKTHPKVGADYLTAQGNVPPAIIDAVRHHHEYLDGSGYPDRLSGAQISAVARIMTVCDIYGALVEERSYKPAKTQSEALYVLIGMAQQGKVDYRVVRTFAAALGTALPETAQ